MRQIIVLTIFVSLAITGPAYSEITVEPFGFAISVEENGEANVELQLSNSSEDEVGFNIDYELVADEDERRGGPRRDDLGDILHEFDVPNGGANQQKVGVAWDWGNEWMWISNNPNSSVVAVDPNNDYEVAREIDIENPWNVTCLYGHLYVISSGLNLIHHYDTEGENLGNINVGFNVSAITRSEELGLLFLSNDNGRAIHVFTVHDNGEPDEQIGIIPSMGGMCGNDNRYRAICWVDAHTEGQFWLTNPSAGAQGGRLWEIFIDTEEWEPVEVVANCDIWPNCAQNRQRFGIGHDGTNIWTTAHNSATVRIIDDNIQEFHMLTIDPEEGIVPGNDSETVNISINTEGCEEGVYNILIEIQLAEPEEERDDLDESVIQISCVVSISSSTAAITGTVTDAANDEPVEGAFIELDRYIIGVHSDEEGNYTLSDLPPGEYELTFIAPDYLPTIETVEVGENDIELNVELFFAECTPSRDNFFMELEPDMSHEFDFEITNGGNGSLTFTVERRLLGGANAEPWELRESVNVENVIQDDMLNGAVFANGYFFISGGNNGEDVSKIYMINTDSEQVDEFDQFVESRYGMRDLAYDGNLIWGADDGTLYGFTTEGELEREFNCPVDIECRSLTCDTENQVLLAADIASNIYAIDLEGDLVENYERPEELRIYGLGFWQDDPDGYPLYAFCRGDSTDLQVNKINLDNGEYMMVIEMNVEGGRPGGIHISNLYDICSWVFISVVQNPDRLNIWQLATNREWFRVEPVEGVIEAEQSGDFTLTLDATDLQIDNTLEGEVVFRHDGVGAETVLDVRLGVVEGEVHTTRDIPMEIGWNLISANLQPDNEEDIRALMAALVEEELLILMKNSDGEFYRPDYDYNDIPGWYVDEGYQMLVSGDCMLTLEGMSVLRDRAIPLEQGWQIVSYYPRSSIDAIVALSGIVDHLIIAKDGRGNFYLPDWDFSNMGNMREGQGYYLNVDEDVELVYQIGEEANALGSGMRQLSVYDAPGRLPVHAATGENMSLLVVESAPPFDSPPAERGRGIKTEASPLLSHERTSIPPLLLQEGSKGGSEIGVYAGGELVGSGVIQNGVCGLAVWGDDPITEAIDGAVDGQALEIRMLDEYGLRNVAYEVLSGETVYKTNSFAVIRLTGGANIPAEFGIVSVYPNPFNYQTRIVYGLPETVEVNLCVYDLTGRRIVELAKGERQVGIHSLLFDGSCLASGVYLVRLEAGGETLQWKVALVK